MSGVPRALSPATYADLERLGDIRAEIVHGSIVERASPSPRHGVAQLALGSFARRRYGGPGGRWPGGWWIGVEIDVEYAPHELFCHDVVGWRRERLAELPERRPVRMRPDWVCEVLSPSNRKRDLLDKMQVLKQAGVPYYWIVDPDEKMLVVHRLEANGYLIALTASTGETVRAEPFDEVELPMGVLFGDQYEED